MKYGVLEVNMCCLDSNTVFSTSSYEQALKTKINLSDLAETNNRDLDYFVIVEEEEK